jgi:hypothetical protein
MWSDSLNAPEVRLFKEDLVIQTFIDDFTTACDRGWQHTSDRIYLLGEPVFAPTPTVTSNTILQTAREWTLLKRCYFFLAMLSAISRV